MRKIKLTRLEANDMRVISVLLKKEVENPINIEFSFISDKFFVLDFVMNRVLVNLFQRRFNKVVFEDRKHQVVLTQIEAICLLQLIRLAEKQTIEASYEKVLYTDLKISLCDGLLSLPTYENLPF
ncbi:hypothetical protein [uncultured Microscilla sp.]|uniref:hypothetical protein n=1 Tax=uncultured Microscilla sp. TaxID=432653 RepID=UPI00261B1932|nr:hypothetical protein [uncultured Microscilla sp.]